MSLRDDFDALLLDLDGTVFRGSSPTPGAIDVLAVNNPRNLYVTNNASRSPEEVAAHLRELGFNAVADDVVTSAQAAARLLADKLDADAPVLVVGTEALANEIRAVGLTPVRTFDENPVAVVQGHSVDTAWPILAEAALAIRGGALWVAANVDTTLPTERGLLPGNGSLVAALRAATDTQPLVAGKPGTPLLHDARERVESSRPLIVGDRLDTDIEGACAVGVPSLMVLTGVSSAREAITAREDQRPTYIGADLRALNLPAAELAVGPSAAWTVTVDAAVLTVASAESAVHDAQIVAALAHACWTAGLPAADVRFAAADETADAALTRWGLL